jgi:flagella basal body P-ring formation protein FlgA
LVAEVEIASIIVRVGDVVRPVGTPPRGWDDLASRALAPLPTGGFRLRMDRQRISECLQRSGLLPGPPVWSGPSVVAVTYRPDEPPVSRLPYYPGQSNHSASIDYPSDPSAKSADQSLASQYRSDAPLSSADGAVAPIDGDVRAAGFRGTDGGNTMATSLRHVQTESDPKLQLLPAERNRIERMILSAFPLTHAEVLKNFDVAIPADSRGVDGLKDLRAVRSLRMSEDPRDGRIELFVAGETQTEKIESVVELELSALPVVICTTTHLNRGDILSPRDLVAKPISRQQFDPRYVTDLSTLVNKEMTRTLSQDRPISVDDVTEPVIIKRGDNVELRVVGAGVTVVTEAKALASAAAGESLFVETINPRQKLAARAVSAGVVEIVTRPPSINADR